MSKWYKPVRIQFLPHRKHTASIYKETPPHALLFNPLAPELFFLILAHPVYKM